MAKSNNIETRYLETEEYSLWDTFVDQSKDGTIFHKTNWLRTFADWQHLKLCVAGCFKGTELTGGMAFTWKKKFGIIPVMQQPVKTPFFSPVIANSQTGYLSKIESQLNATLNSLIDFLSSEFKLLQIQFPPSFSDIRTFLWKDFESSVHYTYLTAIQQLEDLISVYDPSVRRQIKKGGEQNYSLYKDNSREFIEAAWELEQKSFKRQQLDMQYATNEDFVSFIELLAEQESAQTYTIKFEDRAIASQIVLLDNAKKSSYYWLAGVDNRYLSTGLNQLLLHKILTDLQDRGYQLFDFVGAGTKTIAKYKSTFNFPLVPMYSVRKAGTLVKFGLTVKKFIQ
ncbi:MAG TPA: GNAT family N-acetyltransferase [Bacteroidales bacterium]|nr:GNAT family N-acetyltransferase [Bacteroidales bacterium]